MNTHRNRKKLFIAGTFVLLLMLAFGSMITFAKNGARTSYTLTIVKKLDLSKFPDGTDLDALSYNFNVTGATSANPPVPIDQQVTIDNFQKAEGSNMAEGSATIDLGGSAAVSVIELTNTLDPDLIGLGVSETSYRSHMHANNGYAEVTLSKEKNWLTITPSASADGVEAINRVYRVTWPDGSAKYQSVKDGESWELKDLPAGNYIIEAVKAPDGFSMELENPEIPVASGDRAAVEINGESGSMVVTAGGTKGDGQIHHFVATKSNNSSFEEEFSLASGETYTRDHLTNGTYTLSTKTFEGTPAFSVTASGTPTLLGSSSLTYPTKNTPELKYGIQLRGIISKLP